MENVQYRARVAITAEIQGTSWERLYRDPYLNLNNSCSYIPRSSNRKKIKGICTWNEQFKYSFFPFCINKWNNPDNMIKKVSKHQIL